MVTFVPFTVQVVDSYTRILMVEQRKGRFIREGENGDVFVFDSMVLVSYRKSLSVKYIVDKKNA